MLTPWPAPLYWQSTANQVGEDTRPANSLVFVGMTLCRVVDTRTGSGFTGAFGPPSLVGGASRTIPIQSSSTCSIPSIAQAYSFNITLVPPGFVDFITVWPTGQPRPNASTLNGYVSNVIANAAIVPAGTSGSVDVYASQTTNLIIDINGYYAQQTGITLAQGTAASPSLSFSSDAGTGIFSSGAGSLDITTGGTTRLTVRPDGDLDVPGSVRKFGNLWFHSLGSGNTGVGVQALEVNSGQYNTATGSQALHSNTTGFANTGVGSSALNANTTGSDNTAVGSFALYHSTEGDENTAAGVGALQSNTLGDKNTVLGTGTLGGNTEGGYNTATGAYALSVNTTGNDNTADGEGALGSNTAGIGNTAVGEAALSFNTTGIFQYGNWRKGGFYI
jgi:hypothetical protein